MPNSPYKEALELARTELTALQSRKVELAAEQKSALDEQQKAARVVTAIESMLPQHIDSDRHRGPSDWDRECQESGRLNR